ncbi:envelope-like protein, partial [Trifolium medium]|nr:envelope-like protein [Trifolium medium]
GETQTKKPAPLTFDYRLFVGSHVPDIVISKTHDGTGTSASLTKATKDEVLAELLEVSKALGETIKASTTRNMHVDNLIKSMTKEQEAEVEERDEEEDIENNEINP